MLNDPTNQNQTGSIMGFAKKVPDNASQGLSQDANSQIVSAYETFASKSPPLNAPYGSRTEKVINNFLQSPVLKSEDREPNELLRDTVCFLIHFLVECEISLGTLVVLICMLLFA